MKTTKTYATLTNAYAAVEKAKAIPFIVDRSYEAMVIRALDNAHMKANKRNLAVWNLVKFENTLCALEEAKDGFKWTAIGHFDNDGLLYPVGTETPKTEDKPKVTRTRKPKQTGKGVAKALGKTEKRAIRSECYKLAKGDIAKYDALCKERGVDNGR